MKVALLLVIVPSLAFAEERATTITLGGMAGAFERSHHEVAAPDGVLGPRVTLAWEHAPLVMPDSPGYSFGGSLVPELLAGAFVEEDRAEAFIGAGVRLEVKMAQREMGLLKVSARGSAYVAGRGMVVGDQRKPFGEIAVGDYWFVGKATRIGFEGSVIFGKADQMTDYEPRRNVGGVVQLYIGWAP